MNAKLGPRAEMPDGSPHHDEFANEYDLEFYPAERTDGEPAPFAVIIPGGAYGMVSTHNEGLPFALGLNAHGYAAFVVYYHIGDGARLPAPQDDVGRAVREILDHAEEYGVDPEGYSVWGSSAGGHLAASFCTKEFGYAHYGLPRPGALILAYPVVSMGKSTHPETRLNLLGPDPDPDLVRRLSIQNQVDADFPPTFTWHNADDGCVVPHNSELLAAALEEAGVEHCYQSYPTGGHGVGLGRGLSCDGWFEDAVSFWGQAL